MRALVIGTGSIGRRHMASLSSLVPQVRFDILREAGRSASVEGLPGEVSVSSTLDQALDKRPALMVVASPSSMHLRPLLAAIERGIPFYAEKPVVTTADDVVVLRLALARSPRVPPNIVGCNLRFLPSLQRLKSLVTRGELGRVVRAGFEAGQWLPDWRPQQDYRRSYSASRALGGGVLFDLIHEIDAARWLLGDFPVVQAAATRASGLEIETEDCATLLLSRSAGPLATVQLDYVSRRPVRRYMVVGDAASAEWDLPRKSLTLSGPEGVQALDLPADAFDVPRTYPAAMRELLDAVAQDRPTSQPLEEGLKALELVMRARASAHLS
ncbi:MAG: Gfo/Idh/MocA family oxidoreductase [Rhizobacter sp.]|nr:Gfo/Idh/MocA family oxidoreductase [Rhizobacter sp.]